MAKISGYRLDSEELLKLSELTGNANTNLFQAYLHIQDAQQVLGYKHSFVDEKNIFALIIEMQHHVIEAQRCIDALQRGLEETFAEADLRFGTNFHEECDDCGENTVGLKEYYMVLDDLWAQARKQPVNGGSELPVTATLCIGCLEARLGRQLTPSDFQHTIGERSRRLQDRVGEKLQGVD